MEIAKSTCAVIADQVVSDGNYELMDWKLERFSELVGYHGDHGILKIKIKLDGKEKELTCFLKNVINIQVVLEKYLKKIRCFEKEYYMLSGVLDDLQAAVKQKLTSRCYYREMNKIIILEDLSVLGYRAAGDKSTRFDHVKITLQKLAVLHAASIIIEEKSNCDVSEKYSEIAFETFFNDIDTDEGLATRGSTVSLNHILYNRIDDIPEDKREPFMNWFYNVNIEHVKPSKKYRNVICHGDPWPMNFMYKYDESGELKDALMVDFQASRIAPPALEIQQFLTLTYFNDDREKHCQNLFDIYYKKLEETLKKSLINIADILPRDEYDESLEYYLSFALCGRVLYNLITRMPQEYLKLINTEEKFVTFMTEGDIDLITEAFDKNQLYRKYCTDAITGAYNHFIKLSVM